MAPARTSATSATNANSSAPADDNLAKRGRQLARLHNMWPNGDVILLGKQMQAMSDDALYTFRQGANEKKLRLITLVETLTELEPTLFERLNRPGPHAASAARDAKSRLNIGVSNGRSEDARKARDMVDKWDNFLPPLGDKSTRGLSHLTCARHLVPPTLNIDDEQVATQLMVHGIPALTASLWPGFLWAAGRFNVAHPHDGLLEGELLFSCGNAVLFSPLSSIPSALWTGGARGHTKKRRGPTGVAKSYQMTEVTTGFIPYIACVTRHALTSDEVFSEVCGAFSYVDFYWQIRSFLEDPKFAGWTRGLLDRWNEKLFSGIEFYQSTASAPEVGGTLAMLNAELEAGQITPQVVGLGTTAPTNETEGQEQGAAGAEGETGWETI
ncbi:hypothetical protein FRC12_002796 [Ceratobasidium sp. 428]|nr:hypothetical protein FRC12_002796 [Ceratobasidium sp. 428]